ncbi:hypothetical protein HU200_048722 [Digitaria exilis]|uniref:Uncharacterized protein n=1 Tax=Digitaria exilis TaxID=1010633 RepID=A0A835E782_9POAL|nr:hypothetical protein HU200_048722 [Digitaria exilis]
MVCTHSHHCGHLQGLNGGVFMFVSWTGLAGTRSSSSAASRVQMLVVETHGVDAAHGGVPAGDPVRGAERDRDRWRLGVHRHAVPDEDVALLLLRVDLGDDGFMYLFLPEMKGMPIEQINKVWRQH